MGIETFQNSSVQSNERDLLTPGSFSVSTLLMEDAVPGGAVSAGSGRNQIALFSNPFKGGAEEALVINAQRELTYLQRTNEGPTGWNQTEIPNAVKLAEVVVAEHPDGSLWAFGCPPSGSTQAWDVRKLTGQRSQDGTVTCTWTTQTAFLNPLPPSGYLSVSYGLDSGATILGGYSYQGMAWQVLAIYPNIQSTDPKSTYYPWGFVTSGTQTNTAGRVLGGGYMSAGSRDNYSRYVAYIGYPTLENSLDVWRLEFGQGPDWTMKIPEQGSPIRSVCGQWIVPSIPNQANCSDVGCIYLDANGRLHSFYRLWESTKTVDMSIPTEFASAKTWQDADGDLHIFGLTSNYVLQVLHQSGWRYFGSPPSMEFGIQWTEAVTEDGASTPATVGLATQVDSFELDPYPDYEPNEWVRVRGAPASEASVLYAQDVITSRWAVETVRLPSAEDPQVVTRYVADATLLDKYGTPMPDHLVNVTADSLVEVQVNAVSFLVGPGKSADVRTNVAGRLTISIPAQGLVTPIVFLSTEGLDQAAAIDFDAPVNDYLAGKGKLPSQKGVISSTGLKAAQCTNSSGQKTDLVDWSKFPDWQPETVVTNVQTMYNMAAGDRELPKLVFDGYDEPQVVAGYAIQVWDPTQPTFQAFRTAEELETYRTNLRTDPAYGGWWEDSTKWASDVWQGIRSGATKVAKFIVDGTSSVIQIVVSIGGKLVEIARWIITSIEQAAQAVESLFAMLAGAATRTLDWLKTLFNFTDIWNTKVALESGFKTVAKYFDSTIKHYAGMVIGDTWFVDQQANVNRYFDSLLANSEDVRLGDLPNNVEPIPDASGGTLDTADLKNPQASWFMDRSIALTQGEPAFIRSSEPHPLDATLNDLVDSLSNSVDFGNLVDAWSQTTKFVRDFFDTDSTAASSRSTYEFLVNGIRELLLKALQAADAVFGAVVKFARDVAVSIEDLLFNTHLANMALVEKLYQWIQSKARPEEEVENLTPGGFACLVLAFFETVIYKLVVGVDKPPFPKGEFTPVAPPPWYPGSPALGDESPPESAPDNIGYLTPPVLRLGLGVFAGITTAATDLLPPNPPPGTAKPKLLNILQIAGDICNLVLTIPMFSTGSTWDPYASSSWGQNILGLVSDVGGTFGGESCDTIGNRSTLMKNLGKVAVKGGVKYNTIYSGTLVTMFLGCINTIAGIVKSQNTPPYPKSPSGAVALSWTAAVMTPIAKLLQGIRAVVEKVIENYPQYSAQARQVWSIVGVADGILTGAGHEMAGFQAVVERYSLPVITNGGTFHWSAEKDFSLQVQATGGSLGINDPLKNWQLANVEPAPVTPHHLGIDQNGLITGNLAKNATNTYTFDVWVSDNYGPPQYTEASFIFDIS
ncbi:hypothetical protein [Streptomyces sp. NPDC048419]|uniref:hypothetical protein n=1 Tax=Streptomyces sp. NPDC048419 TaxID=3365547 RepID=UPI0037212BCF